MICFFSMRYAGIVLLTYLCSLGIAIGDGLAQEDPLHDARNYPPHLLKSSHNALLSLNWQIEQLDSLISTYRKSKDEIINSISITTQKKEELYRQLPSQFGSAKLTVLSNLIGDAMAQRMELRLELVALEAQMAAQQEKMTKDADLLKYQKEQLNIEMATAAERAKLAATELKRAKKLFAAGSFSDLEMSRKTANAEIATMELRAAEVRAKVEMQRAKAAASSAITDARLEMAPIKAKLKVIDEFLSKISDASKTSRRIDQQKRDLELLHRDLELVAEQLFDLGRRKTELVSLRDLILKDVKANKIESETESEEKD